MSEIDLDAIEARAEAATPAPWTWGRSGVFGEPYADVITGGVVECSSYCYGGSSTVEGDNFDVDAAFIAHARTDIPALIARVRELEAVVVRVTDALNRHPRCEKYADDDAISCGWKSAVADITHAIEGDRA